MTKTRLSARQKRPDLETIQWRLMKEGESLKREHEALGCNGRCGTEHPDLAARVERYHLDCIVFYRLCIVDGRQKEPGMIQEFKDRIRKHEAILAEFRQMLAEESE